MSDDYQNFLSFLSNLSNSLINKGFLLLKNCSPTHKIAKYLKTLHYFLSNSPKPAKIAGIYSLYIAAYSKRTNEEGKKDQKMITFLLTS